MSDPIITEQGRTLEPVHADETETSEDRWNARLAFFLRAMAALSLLKGLYHWAMVCGIGDGPDASFETAPMAWQTATVFFAVIDLVAAVGLWLTAAISMVAVELLFPQVYGGGMITVMAELGLLAVYLWLALQAAREHPG